MANVNMTLLHKIGEGGLLLVFFYVPRVHELKRISPPGAAIVKHEKYKGASSPSKYNARPGYILMETLGIISSQS